MKKTIYIPVLLAATAVGFASCNKLDEVPPSAIISDNFYKTVGDATAAVTAVYSTLNSDPLADFPIYGRDLNLLIENGSDNQVYAASNTNPDVRALGTSTYVAANDRVKKNWTQHYYGINRANVAIDNIANINIDVTVRDRLVREAKFIRALLYFNAVRLWGDVPLILHATASAVDASTTTVTRAPKADVYAQIIADLNDAINLPKTYNAANAGRVTSGAAHALLAKVYVTQGNWAAAKTELENVINGGYGYALFPKFLDVFQQATKNGVEHIFSVQFGTNLGGKNSTQSLSSANFGSFATSVYPGDVGADSSVFKLFADNDTRRAVTFYDRQFNSATGKDVIFPGNVASFTAPRLAKFIDFSLAPLTTQGVSGINFPVIRYAEVLLLYAEVLNELNVAGIGGDREFYINQVRTRAGIGNITTGLSQSDFRDELFNERRREFIQESQRWFDLARRGTNPATGNTYLYDALSAIPTKTGTKIGNKARFSLFPIPQYEVDLAGLSQNPGW